MEVYFLIIIAIIIAGILIRGAGGGKALSEPSARTSQRRAELPDAEQPWLAKDPVCGAVGPVGEAVAVTEHEGGRFHFCSARCKELFDAHPDQYRPSADVSERELSDKGTVATGGISESQQWAAPTLVDWRVTSLTLGSFFAITYVLCVLFGLLFPQWAMYELWGRLLPGFTWLTWGSFLLGLMGSITYGLYIGLLLGPLYNVFARWLRKSNGSVQGAGEGI